MPFGPLADLPVPRDPIEWRPLEVRATRRPPPITDPIIEPCWSGTRVIAHFRVEAGGEPDAPVHLQLLDAGGEDVTGTAPRVVDALSASVMALDAVIDGILTEQATAGGEGTALIPRAEVSRMGLLMPRKADMTYAPLKGETRAGETAFVALDLLMVDGQPLIDLPLLERKRQLESLFVDSELVRISPYARPPLGPWLNTWKAAGFRGVVMKAANSRYRPGDFTLDWTIIERLDKR